MQSNIGERSRLGCHDLGTSNIQHPMNFPVNPKRLLTPALSSFWRGEGDGIVVYVVVHGFHARISRGILALNTGDVGSHQTVKRFQT